jgi:putative ABC transport system permease protein
MPNPSSHPGPERAARALLRLRAMAFPALMLALALGALLAVFSIFDQMVLRPVPGQERLVSLGLKTTDADGHTLEVSPSPAELKDFDHFPGIQGRPVQEDIRPLRVEAAGLSRSVLVAYASADFFSGLGIRPAQGRLFAADDPEPGAVLSWAAWRAYGDPVRGAGTVTVDGVTLPVLGVLPPDFNGYDPGYEPELWVPLAARARSSEREARLLATRTEGISTYARLRPGTSIAQAEAALAPLVDFWRSQRQPAPARLQPHLQPLAEQRREAFRRFLPSANLLWAATALLILMATLNLGNLQVARWMRERQDWATRVALGASPRRLVAELSLPMVATLALGALGALPLARILATLIARFPPPSEYPTVFHPQLDGRVYLLAVALAGLLALPLALLAWAWCLRHVNPGHRVALGGLRWRKALLGIQLALSVALLSGTLGSLAELHRAQRIRLGYQVGGIQAFSFAFPTHVQGGRDAIREGWYRLWQHFQTQPNCQATCVMFSPCEAYEPQLHPYRSGTGPVADCLVPRVFPGTFRMLGIPILLGRDFDATDTPEAPSVALVSAPLARSLWPDRSPLGETLEDDQGHRSQVIGVVADHLWEGIKRTPHMPMVFLSGRQRFGPLQTLLVRSALPPIQLHAWVEQEVARLDPRLAIERAEPLSARVDRLLQPQRLAATLFGMLGAAALALSLLGLYVLQAYLTVQRLPEAGLRMALGATPGQIRLEFLRSLAWPMGLGLGAGLFATAVAWRWLGASLPGLPALNLTVLAGVALGLLGTGLLAAALPLVRLERASPAELLRDPRA